MDKEGLIINAIKESISDVVKNGKTSIQFNAEDISNDVKTAMEIEGFKFELIQNVVIVKGRGMPVHRDLWKISWNSKDEFIEKLENELRNIERNS